MKKYLFMVALFTVLFGCEEGYEEGFATDGVSAINVNEDIEFIEDCANIDKDSEKYLIKICKSNGGQSRSGTSSGWRFAVNGGNNGHKSNNFLVDSNSNQVTVHLDYDSGRSGATTVTLYRDVQWPWPNQNYGTKTYNPSAGGEESHTWYNVRSNDDYFIIIQKVTYNPWVYGDYDMSWQ